MPKSLKNFTHILTEDGIEFFKLNGTGCIYRRIPEQDVTSPHPPGGLIKLNQEEAKKIIQEAEKMLGKDDLEMA